MSKGRKLILCIIIIVFAFLLGDWIGERMYQNILYNVKQEIIYNEGVK